MHASAGVWVFFLLKNGMISYDLSDFLKMVNLGFKYLLVSSSLALRRYHFFPSIQ
jgi:hypothetical protein